MIRNTFTLPRLFSSAKLPPCSFTPPQYSGPSYQQVLADRQKHMPAAYFHYYKQPLLIHTGHMQYLFDHEGKRYLDLIAGICTVSVGHSHPRIVEAIKKQAEKVIHTSPIYMSESQGDYSKHLAQELGPGFENIFMTNSGGEANDLAILLARTYTGHNTVIGLRNGYHGIVGNARAATNVGTWNMRSLRTMEFEKLAWPNLYRGAHHDVKALLDDAEEMLNANTDGKVAGFIFEPIQGVGGIIPLPEGYLEGIIQKVRSRGGLIISDEVQTGFGRVGPVYWGHRWQKIQPDIVSMAKGIANGLPVGAVATRREISDSYKPIYFNTFGGGHLQCVVSKEVLKIIRDEKLPENSEKVGNYLKTEFNKLKTRYPLLGDVRGQGLMMGLELVKDPITKEPAKEETNQMMELTRERGLLFGKGGRDGNVMRMQPPMCMTLDDAKYVIQAYEDALDKVVRV